MLPAMDHLDDLADEIPPLTRRLGGPVWPVHRANDRELVVIAPDELAAAR